MKYSVLGKGKDANKLADQVVTRILQEYSRQLFGFTRAEFDSIVEYDVLNIMAFYYSKMNAQQKAVIVSALEDVFGLSYIDDTLENLAMFADDEVYVPLSCKLMDRLGDSRVTIIVYESIFKCCTSMVKNHWNQSNSYSNYLVLLNAAFFSALSYKLHVKDSCSSCMKVYYEQDSYDDFVESLYEKHLDDLSWDSDVELDVLDELIADSKSDNSFEEGSQEEFMDAVEVMGNIRRKHVSNMREEANAEGFAHIVQKTGIREQQCVDIQGFECHFCEAKFSDEKYIIVYQKDTHIRDIIDNEEQWSNFQRELYREDIRQDTSKAMVYIVYILDDNSDNIPIQVIESNKTYGRKYVFSEDETITFINGIVKTTSEEIGNLSPVQEWDRILREEHLTACLTEPYSAKKVENYLSGQRFDADYVHDDDYSSMKHSKVPQIKWVKSLETTGFRDFCFDKKTLTFGQINLFYGANGSGKTSVLEAIEYALTSEVRRVKDFKVKLPTDSYPRLNVYDTEAGVHTFYPGFSKKNNKEIERVWYGVPIGRTKSNLNANFNRFNAFDSEAAYKFIHESDNSEDSFSSMFGNLMFGENIVDHEKKWQRFKKAFNDRYTELRSELAEARSTARYYEESLAHKTDSSKSDEIEAGIIALKMRDRTRLPKGSSDRYAKVLEEMKAIRKYVDILSSHHLEANTFAVIAGEVADTKKNNLLLTRRKKEKADEITRLADENGSIKKEIFDEREKQTGIQQHLERINTDISDWTIVQNVLSHEDTIKLVNDLLEEMTQIEHELYYIAKIEQRTSVINFLKLDDHKGLIDSEKQRYETELKEAKTKRLQVENKYNEAKKAFGEIKQQAIELRKIGKTLMSGAKCPLCGHEYSNPQQLIDIIDSVVVVDDEMEALISELQDLSKRIMELEKILDRQKLIDKAKEELLMLEDAVPMVRSCGTNYKKLYEYVASKAEKEKRKTEIVEQQTALDSQGFSIRNITACKEYKTTNSTYLEYKKFGKGTYTEFLQNRLQSIQLELVLSEGAINKKQRQIQQNEQKEELLRSDIHSLNSQLESLDMDTNRDIEQALENLKTKYNLSNNTILGEWVNKYHSIYDKCELEVERLESQNMIAFEKLILAEQRAIIKRDEPMIERCARAVQAFEKMPSLSSFVEHGIRSNIQQISKFFKWMHHSGEFEKLDIDDKGIYAVRGLNHQEVRTYEMSTGQRSTIAMAVMFALHMAAPNAPQFLLLDEPLATMDDTQVLNVLDILKSMAEQNTQIFFTTANGIMINLFKECFKNTSFDYKEYQFIKRVNRPSEIKESSINNTKTIEELTLDDLTLDFHQFAQIRNILRKNQEKLVARDEWEELPEDIGTASGSGAQVHPKVAPPAPENFYATLDGDERRILDVLVADQPETLAEFMKLVSPFPDYKTILEQINEKALDFYEETIIDTDEMLPYVEEDYLDELRDQHDNYYAKNSADLIIEEQRRQAEERNSQLVEELKKSEEERRRLEEESKLVAERRSSEEAERAKAAERQRQADTARLKEEEQRREVAESQRKAAEEERLRLESELKKSEEERRRLEEESKLAAEQRSSEDAERTRAVEQQRRADAARLKEEEQRREVAESQRKATEEEKSRLEKELAKITEERKALEEARQREADLRKAEEARRQQLEFELHEIEKQNRQQQEHYQEEKRRQEEQRKAGEIEQQKMRYRQMNVCQYCGGTFTGLFNKKCNVCGKPKDYK